MAEPPKLPNVMRRPWGAFDMMQSGQHGRFYWLVAPSLSLSFEAATLRCHPGACLCITSCDSGPIRPSLEDLQVAFEHVKPSRARMTLCGWSAAVDRDDLDQVERREGI